MSADGNKTRHERAAWVTAVAADGPDAASHLRRIAIALERIADSLASAGATVASVPDANHDLLDLAGVAARFDVSTRWVQRHLRASFRASARGKAWYRVADVEEQLHTGVPLEVPRPRRRTRTTGQAKSNMQRAQPEPEIAEVERRLRESVAQPPRRSR